MPLRPLDGALTFDLFDLAWEEERDRVLTESPEIAAALANMESARWDVERAFAEVIPNVDVQAVIQDDRSTGGTNGKLQVTVPIPILNRNQGGIQKALAKASVAQIQVDRLALDLQTRLASASKRYQSAKNQVQLYSKSDGILANAQRTLNLVRAGYRAEEFGVIDLLQAQRTFFQTNLAYLDSLRELSVATMETRGPLLTGSLSE